MSQGRIPDFVRQLGHRVVAYTLNISNAQARELLNGTIRLDDKRQNIFEAYIQMCVDLRARNTNSHDPQYSLVHSLSYQIQNERHVFSLWREELGGVYPKLDQTDRLKYALSNLALHTYPILLLHPASPFPPYIGNFTTFPQSPGIAKSYNDLIQEISGDVSLGKIFSPIDQARRDTVTYFSNAGRGGSILLRTFPETIVIKTYEACQLENRVSMEDYVSMLSKSVDLYRAIAEGKSVDVPVYIGFHNIGFMDITELDTSLGTLKAYSEGVYDLLPSECRPSTLGGEGREVLGLILKTKLSYKVWLDKSRDEKKWNSAVTAVFSNLDDIEKNLCLAITLAVNRTPPVSATRVWTFIWDPISLGANLSYKLNALSPMHHHLLDANDCASVSKWCDRIVERASRNLTIAFHRITSCISERLNPVDGFIDAVIALESMFGTSSTTELKFRMSMGIAKLLESDYGRRVELQKIVSDLYDDRSKIVHGAKTVSPAEATVMRNSAVDIALRCLRVLFEAKTELLSSNDRSKQILLS